MMNDSLKARLAGLDGALMRHVRPETYPLAIRMLKPGEPIPEGLRNPREAFKENWIVCQSIGIARRYGWGIVIGRDDVICPLASIAFGFRAPNDEYLRGQAAVGMYCENDEAAARLEAATWRFEPGTYKYLCVAPISRAAFEPDVIAVYGNSAQVMRMVTAALYKRGGRLESTTGGRLDCADIVIQTLRTDQPKVIIPCNGDRVFGMTQDHEMVFAFPWRYTDEILAGLEGTHKGGVRYPIPVAMRGTVTMPRHYQEIMEHLKARDESGS